MPSTHSFKDESPTSRLELVWGKAGVERLHASSVVVFGCGGVGSNCIESLARGGVGTLVIVDGDEVAPSNINRQAIAFTTTVGRRKIEVMREMVLAINPAAQVMAYDRFLLPDDAEHLLNEIADMLRGHIDYMIDAIDTVSTKLAIAAWAERAGVPLISSMGGAGKIDPTQLHICDIAQTSHDALARVMRKECRKRGIRKLEVLSSSEPPQQIGDRSKLVTKESAETGASHSCAPSQRPPLGTVSYLPPIMGQMIAGHVIRRLVERDRNPKQTTGETTTGR